MHLLNKCPPQMLSSKKYLQTLSSKPPSSVFRTPKIQLFLKTEFNKLPHLLYHVKCSTAKTFAPCWTNLHLSLISPQTLSSKNKNIQVSKLSPQNSTVVHQSSYPRYHLKCREKKHLGESIFSPLRNQTKCSKDQKCGTLCRFLDKYPFKRGRHKTAEEVSARVGLSIYS